MEKLRKRRKWRKIIRKRKLFQMKREISKSEGDLIDSSSSQRKSKSKLPKICLAFLTQFSARPRFQPVQLLTTYSFLPDKEPLFLITVIIIQYYFYFFAKTCSYHLESACFYTITQAKLPVG